MSGRQRCRHHRGRYKQVAKSSRYLIYRFSYGKKLYFSSADDERTGITCTYTKGKNGFKVVYHNGSFLLLQNIESIDISCVPGMEYIENDEELYDREPFTVEEEKLRKEAVQELLIYQG